MTTPPESQQILESCICLRTAWRELCKAKGWGKPDYSPLRWEAKVPRDILQFREEGAGRTLGQVTTLPKPLPKPPSPKPRPAPPVSKQAKGKGRPLQL